MSQYTATITRTNESYGQFDNVDLLIEQDENEGELDLRISIKDLGGFASIDSIETIGISENGYPILEITFRV